MKPTIKKRALITGASGFVGGNLARRLLADGWDITQLVREHTDRAKLVPPGPNCRIAEHDGSTMGAIRLFEAYRPEYVFHLAATSIAEHRPEDVEDLVNNNIRLGIQLAEAMLRAGTPFMINTGTFWQHKSAPDYAPACLYAATKQALQDVLRFYAQTSSSRLLTLKLMDTYGPADSRGRLFSLLAQWREGDAPLKFSPGQQLLDLVHVDDVADAYLHAAHLLSTVEGLQEDYFVRSGRLLTLREIVELFEKISGRKISIEWSGRPYRSNEVMEPWAGAILPDWSPKVPLEKGIQSFLTARV
jgi:nucleoside-diphosphate-sugar epimerase